MVTVNPSELWAINVSVSGQELGVSRSKKIGNSKTHYGLANQLFEFWNKDVVVPVCVNKHPPIPSGVIKLILE